ncbi:MAG: TMEM165/GDT1 family protein [Firmicutes bacterium]|nr:TMEM165/GDT1 family protein [Bacillota bacterium]
MVWKTVITTFSLVFLAELGDKTQLATMLLAAESHALWSVFLGSATALVLSSLIGVVAGEALTRVVPSHYLQTGAGVAFIILGAILLLRRG